MFHEGDMIRVRLESLNQDREWITALEPDPGAEGALFAMDAQTGRVLCMVGGRDFASSQFNRATQAIRQPGSAFKPMIYAAALDKGYTEISILMDTPLMIRDHSLRGFWRPANYDRKFWGPTPLRKALIHSRNVVTVKLLNDLGIDYTIEYVRNLGITSPLAQTLSLALGASDVTLRELITAYSPFANNGLRVEPYIINRIVDRHGNTLEAYQIRTTPVISPQTAYIMTDLLRGVVQEGTGRNARALERPAAGKTGTTNEMRDAWFIGYTPEIIAGVWVGYDDPNVSLGRGETGGRTACPIWTAFMKDVLEGTPVQGFTIPDGIVLAEINPDTGALGSHGGSRTVYAPFAGQVPRGGTVTARDELDQYLGQGGAKPSEDFFKSDLF
jgi:penicillin-binding protein 1A